MSEPVQMTVEQMRELHQRVPVVLDLNLNNINDILTALSKAPLEFAFGPHRMIMDLTTPQVQAWDEQQAAKAQAEKVTDVEPKPTNEAT
jgi:hypothetical protein